MYLRKPASALKFSALKSQWPGSTGEGETEAEGGKEEVAWRDFCNDVLSSGKDISAHGVQAIDLAAKYDPKKNASFNDSALAGLF
jgi:hypothetical protein